MTRCDVDGALVSMIVTFVHRFTHTHNISSSSVHASDACRWVDCATLVVHTRMA